MSTLWDVFGAPVTQYGFMRYGLAVAVIVGVTSAVLSCLLVVRRWALLGDAISHAVLLGVAVGWLAARHVGIFWGALAAGVLTGVAITWVERNSRVKYDAAMGILFTFAFALGIAIISVTRPRGIDLFHILFGNVLGVSPTDLWLTGVSGGLVLVTVLVLFKAFHLWSFDPVMAQAAGLRVRALHYLFTALLSATIVAALQGVGLILVIAMLITPGATAYLLSDRLAAMMWIAAGAGLLASIGGLYGSFYLDVASGPAMVILVTFLFALALAFAPKRGVVTRRVRRRHAARRALTEDLLKAVFKAEEEGDMRDPVALAGRVGGVPHDVKDRADRLARHGLLEREGGAYRTSQEGRDEALRLVRAHRLIERYLSDAERLPIEELHDEAERLEHVVRPELVDDIDRALGRPATDPHGHPIPTVGGELAPIAGRTILEIPPGASGRVLMVRDDREDLLREMSRAGILPAEIVTVLERRNGGVRVRIGGREVELNVELGERVFVGPPVGGAEG